jgi:WD40 repeat protein
VRLWDVEDLTAPPVVLQHEVVPGFEKAGVTAVAFSSDGRRLATGSGDKRVRLWDVGAEASEPTLRVFPEAVTDLDFSPDGPLAVSVKDGDAYLWDVDDPTGAFRPLVGHEDEVTSVAFSPDGRWLATGSRDRTIRLWDPGDATSRPPIHLDQAVTSLAYSPDGRQLAAGESDGQVRLWNVDGDHLSSAFELNADVGQAGPAVTGVAFSADGQTLIVAAGSTVQLWDLGLPEPANSAANPTILRDHTGKVTAVAYGSDGLHFASSSEDGTARVWLPLGAMIDLTCRDVGRNLTRKEWARFLPDEGYRKTCEEWPEGT